MRSFEIPAIGTSMLAEDTSEHRALFGREGDAVLYFGTIPEMTDKLNWLLENDGDRVAMGRWAAGELGAESWDVIHGWSGVSEEIYRDQHFDKTLKLVMRGSAHIRE